jgi:hypothetical protein
MDESIVVALAARHFNAASILTQDFTYITIV